MSQATKNGKLRKPHDGFPLTPRTDGRWQVKRRGRVFYFTGDAKEALKEWDRVRADIENGHDPRPATSQTTVQYLVNHFLTDRQEKVDDDELSERSWRDYRSTCGHVVKVFGKTRVVETMAIDDLKELRRHLSNGRRKATLKGMVTRCRVLFKHAYDEGVIDSPLRGIKKGLALPTKEVLEKEKNESGEKLFTPAEIHTMLREASPELKPLILLGINTGIGNTDVATMEPKHIRGDWMVYPRRKNGRPRRGKLWPETLAAIESVGLPFRFRGGPWVQSQTSNNDKLSREMRLLLKEVGISRPRISYYALRHTFRTVADESKDWPAIDLCMGHSDSSMGSRYRQTISDVRLAAISDHVHRWLFGDNEAE